MCNAALTANALKRPARHSNPSSSSSPLQTHLYVFARHSLSFFSHDRAQLEYSKLEDSIVHTCNTWLIEQITSHKKEGKVRAVMRQWSELSSRSSSRASVTLITLITFITPITHICFLSQSAEYIAAAAGKHVQQLRDITRPALFCHDTTWPKLFDILKNTFVSLDISGGAAALQLDEQREIVPWPVDCVQQHYEYMAEAIPEDRLSYCKHTHSFAGKVTTSLRLKNRKAFWAVVAPLRYVARMLHLARRNVKSTMVYAVPRPFGAVFGRDRVNLCCALLAAHVTRGLSGTAAFFRGHQREKCKGLHVSIARRVCSRYCQSIKVTICALLQ